MIARDIVQTLVPHRDKMLLLDFIVDYSEKEQNRMLISRTKITSDNLFYEKEIEGVPSYLAFELMAQSISCLSGLYNKKAGNAVKIGVILSVSNLLSYIEVFPKDCIVETTVKEDCALDNLYTFNGTCSIIQGESAPKKAVTATLNVMDVDDITQIKQR